MGTRVPFGTTAAPDLLTDRSKDVPLTLVRDRALQEFLWQQSQVRGLRLCSKQQPCHSAICPSCRGRRATKYRAGITPVADGYADVLEVVLSIRSQQNLADAWARMAEARIMFLENGWLTKKSDAWLRQTEVTHGPDGWHLHDNYLIFDHDPAVLEKLAALAVDRWIDCATRTGSVAGQDGQHARLHHGTRQRVLYVTKGLMTQKGDPKTTGHTPADLLALYQAGDADAADRWDELEVFVIGARRYWRAKGGKFRGAGK